MKWLNKILLLSGLLGFVVVQNLIAIEKEDTSVQNLVHVIKVDGIINPVSAEFITRSIERAEQEGVHCLIIELDTPGGLLESTRQITKAFLASKIPIVVYVYPQGARAASAGVFVTYAAHIAAMAPSTNIGAASPVSIGAGGQQDSSSVLMHKIMNDAVAQVKALAEKRGRNAKWAEKAVREAVSITEKEALQLNVINFISPSVDSLLKQIHGMEVEVATGKYKLNTKNARVVYREMNWRYRILDKISNPNVAYILLLLGIYGLIFELANPGSIFPGVVGAIFLILAFFALQTLPVNYAGLLLILLAIILFILEIKITSYGLLTIGGIISMLLGSLMLIEQPPKTFAPALSISLSLIVTFVILTALFFIFAIGMAAKTHRKKVTTGPEGIIGEIGVAQTKIAPEGKVNVHGEIWGAFSENSIKKGEKVRVVNVEGLRLKVEKASKET
ncbi:MAG: nodulation protein NfeD [Calditrichaeota bacterium]|nr:MAG: nodulation protein NfeD [Calditrichota bacterium]